MSLGTTVELKRFAGQPWSAWTDYLGFESPPEVEEEEDEQVTGKKEKSGTMRLNKSDMGIYGQYPGAEPFELAICEFCGDKFKLAALAEHIGLRHDGKEVPAVDINSVAITSKAKILQLHLQKKGKSPRHARHGKDVADKQFALPVTPTKAKSKTSDDKAKILFTQESPTKLEEIKPLPQTSVTSAKLEKPEASSLTTLLKQDPAKLKQLKLKLKKSKESSTHLPPSKVVPSKNVLKNGGWLHANSANIKMKEKMKTENGLKKAVTKQEQISSPTNQKELSKSTDDISKMQPVVQLSPLDYSQSPVKVQQGSQEPKKKVKNDKKVVSVKDRTYNPDRHCGVVGKENTKPCTRSLTCKSHSMSLRRAVRGRSKAFDILLADHRAEKEKEIYKRKIMGSRSIVETQLNSGVNVRSPPNGIVLTTNQKVNPSIELRKLKSKTGRNMTSDYSRLSLPVSIKNPNNIFTQFQSSNDEKGKGTFATVMTTGAVNTMKIHGASSILKKQIFNPLLARQDTIAGAVMRNVHHMPFQIQPPQRLLAPKPLPLQIEVYRQWHPGFRRTGGLLYTNNQIPKVNGTRLIAPKPDNQNLSSIVDSAKDLAPQVVTVVQTKPSTNLIQVGPSPQQEIVKRIPLTLGPGKKKAVATLIPKQATSLLMPVNLNGKSLLNNQQQKLATVVQVSSPPTQNGFICSPNQLNKRKAEDSPTTISAKKMKKEGKLDVGPIIAKTSGGAPVMRLSIANGILEKNVVSNASVPFTASRQFQPGVSILQNNGIRISSPQRVHYMTSSGPLPVTLQPLPVIPQMQLKPVEVKARTAPKLKLITPNGMVFIQKDQHQQ